MKKSILLSKTFGVVALGVAIALPALFFAPSSSAATTNANLTVSAQVNASCTISAATLGFGTISSSSNNTTNTTFTVTCTNGTTYSVAMGDGQNGTTDSTRAMTDGSGNLLAYQLYTDTSDTNVWASTCSGSGSDCAYKTGSGTAQTIHVYGEVPAGQYVTPGSYNDTVQMTVNY